MKLHLKNTLSDTASERIYPLASSEDFEKLISDFPQLNESMLRYSDLRLIVKDMAGYLNKHHIHAWVTED